VYVTGVILAAGGSRRLGAPKQLLAYGGTTLLGASVERARLCRLDQLVVALGASSEEIRARVDLGGTEVVENPSFGEGCSSSIKTALDRVDPRAEGILLLLGDQPEVDPAAVRRLVDEASGSSIGVCRYDDGRGHPFWIHRGLFDVARALHGDKAIWKLVDSGRHPVTEIDVRGRVPRDVDTWEEYERLLESSPGSAG
jgi:molybdenum cofactor cytidylyltransferase